MFYRNDEYVTTEEKIVLPMAFLRSRGSHAERIAMAKEPSAKNEIEENDNWFEFGLSFGEALSSH